MNKVSLDACAKASKQGIIVVRSTRVATGIVGRNVECNDDELGLIASYGLNPQKSRILLSVALLKKRSLSELQKIFEEY
ncbi:L-asparaginase 2 precursor [compost metagenome]